MSSPSPRELEFLATVAAEVFDAVDGEAYTVNGALELNPTFRDTAGPGNTLQRSILIKAIRQGASRAGLGAEPVGGGLEIISDDPGGHPVRRIYRVKRVTRSREDNHIVAVCSHDSGLQYTEPDELWNVERWILGFRSTDDHTLAELFVAEILGFEDKGRGPLHIRLGNPYPLTPTTRPGGFVSDSEPLFLYDEEEGGQEDGGAVAG